VAKIGQKIGHNFKSLKLIKNLNKKLYSIHFSRPTPILKLSVYKNI